MAEIIFADENGSPQVEFTRNHSFPAKRAYRTPATITGRAGDGTVIQERKGSVGRIALTWPEACPMPADEYADLVTFFGDYSVREWIYTDEHGDDFDAVFVGNPLLNFQVQAHGYSGTLEIAVFDA